MLAKQDADGSVNMSKVGDLDWSDLFKSEDDYEFSHSMSPKGVLTVTAKHKKDGIVGTASFSHSGTTDRILQANRQQFGIRGLMPETADVHPDHRRKGVATKMYSVASKAMNQPIIKPPEEHQTQDARMMWQAKEKLGKSWPEWTDDDVHKVFGNARMQLQATDQQLFGHLVRTEEQIKKAEAEYEDKLNKWYAEANKNIDNQEVEWGEGKSFNSTLTEQERLRRNMHLGDDGDF